ncbi:MAG: heat-inducible transcriptional repressor, partial [Actinomycetota bacterium]|nr:heat-inducible transcriptional repressor [Actinomycetota bacterium]
MSELDERKAAVLRAIVEQYVDTAQPVGSQTVTSTTGLGVSAATVRNEMSVLEREGYIAQPHPSAGRVPTDLGYRYYVDHLAGAGQLPAIERRRIVEFFSSATLAMDQLLAQTSQLLAGVSAHAAVVVGPETQAVVVRAANLVLLQPRLVLAVVVLSNGSVEKEVIGFGSDLSEDDVADASARFARQLGSRRLADLALAGNEVTPSDTPQPDPITDIVNASRVALQTRLEQHQSESLYVGGASRLAAEHDAFVTTNTARLLEL